MTTHTDLPAPLRDALDAHDAGDELTQLWHALGAAAPAASMPPAAHDAAWARIAGRTAVASRPRLTVVRGTGVRRVVPWAIAAALLIGVALAGAPSTDAWTGDAQTSRVIALHDGSRVQLNAGSRLSMAREFRGWFRRSAPTRAVDLDGEAFFTVAKDGRPFVVRTADATVTVLGTRFDVRGFRTDGVGTTVVVEEGRVRVTAAARPTAVAELTAGARAEVRGGALRTDTVAVARHLAWRSGGLALVDQSLALVFAELGRRYGVVLDVAPGVAAHERLTLYYPQLPRLETVLADVATSHGLRFERRSRGFRIVPAVSPAPPRAQTDE
ncbi:MAG: FecR domain-containing protein [Gemmatimonadaceae bacterium]|jgi:ferric-dicitrate binding protein FerR (iron transport regulator)|nr:FecR domain-containing protein [Gemmatimonadaceae bacterium]